ncbi:MULTISPECIES: hypothetical protein [Methylobacterium]|uniref:Uncharacterized protein n=1 Tax=Methylobacterium jeotgali TaxID=381630 RepID=A0ABQ4SS87_9HYPH|nr:MULTISPECIES: hypothetical protein [Methylobacterium]PIU06496.1 MAG: hypothetical protein COT56_09290 [Methylobacterium sp. CG09_land_8_20_14_0_10_71_15]PIU16419.1 MAG: hypothetical protein COT28_00280 [Methylobacterium sp. CG08_land_8_20_14_0_20_71_15]GBU16453.1 hypothetical protein AwMethylo_06680 [Methylobacterium sp.]GJE06062.1 hypothetical protein AOPFMNJM_1368 [Methylobacterium jeotgali]
MTRPSRLAPVLLALALVPASALAAPRSIGDCESLKNDLAFNQCLAMFGPEAKLITGGDGGSGGAASMPAATASAAATTEEPPAETRRSRYGRRSWGHRGRQSMAFAVGEDAPRSYRRRRRH